MSKYMQIKKGEAGHLNARPLGFIKNVFLMVTTITRSYSIKRKRLEQGYDGSSLGKWRHPEVRNRPLR